MARRAPAVERAVAVLNHLALNPGERFTLSEIARALDLNKATLHAILGALTEARYLVRDEKKEYGLGPALVALGNAALSQNPAVPLAVPVMERLTDELGLVCVASASISDEIVILARTGPRRPFGVSVEPGQRLPLAPPLGSVFVAWSGPAQIDRWLGKVGSKASEETLDRYRAAVKATRERGWSVGIETAVPPRGRRARTIEEGMRRIGMEEYALVEFDPKASYRLNHIGAPVFGPDGGVVLALFLVGFTTELGADEVTGYADRLNRAAAEVTEALGGRPPN